MKIKAFLYTHTQITYIILACYLTMNIGQSYAMDKTNFYLNDPKLIQKGELFLQRANTSTDKESSVTPRSIADTDSPTDNESSVTPRSVADTDIPTDNESSAAPRTVDTDAPTDNESSAAPRSVADIDIYKSTIYREAIKALLKKGSEDSIIAAKIKEENVPGRMTSIKDMVSTSEENSHYQLVSLDDEGDNADSEDSHSYQPAPFHSEDENAAKENATKPERTDAPNPGKEIKKYCTYDDKRFYLKSFASATASIFAVLGLAYFAYDLSKEYSEAIAHTLFIDSLIASAILYHRSNMGLSVNDFALDLSGSWGQNTQTVAFSILKLSIASISAGPLAFVTYYRVKSERNANIAAAISGISALACTTALYYKAQTSFYDYMKYRFKLTIAKGDKGNNARFYHAINEELPAINRDEIENLFARYSAIKSKFADSPESPADADGSESPADAEFKNLMRLVIPEENDTSIRFWIKEGAGIAFGAFSAVFGGMYLFLVSDPIYNVMMQDNSRLSLTNIAALTLASALTISIGQNSLQTKSAYDVSKIYIPNLNQNEVYSN